MALHVYPGFNERSRYSAPNPIGTSPEFHIRIGESIKSTPVAMYSTPNRV